MAAVPAVPTVDVAATPAGPPAHGAGALRRVLGAALKTRRGKIGAALALFVLAIAFIGPLIPAKSPTAFAAPPFSKPGVEGAGLLGTDVLGRSVASRVLHGGHTLMLLALASTLVSVGLGAVLGVIAAYRRGIAEGVLMRGVDVVLAIPQLVFALLLLSVNGPSWWLLIVAVGLSQAPQTARVVHAAAQTVCERDFVKAVAIWGVPPRTVIRRHVLPNLTTPLMVEAGLRLSYSIVLIAGLSFLGLGEKPPAPDWGVMVNENRVGLSTNFWGVIAPAIMLAILAVGTNTFADAVARANLGEQRGEEALIASAVSEVSE